MILKMTLTCMCVFYLILVIPRFECLCQILCLLKLCVVIAWLVRAFPAWPLSSPPLGLDRFPKCLLSKGVACISCCRVHVYFVLMLSLVSHGRIGCCSPSTSDHSHAWERGNPNMISGIIFCSRLSLCQELCRHDSTYFHPKRKFKSS